MRAVLRNTKAKVGLAVFGLFLLVAIFGPLVVDRVLHTNPRAIDYDHLGSPPGAPGHPLGTTIQGADVLVQVIIGAQGSVFVGITSGLLATALAVVIGVPSGFLGGRLDRVLTVFTNLFLTLPSFALMLIVAGYIQGADWWVIAILIAAFEWPGGARYLRAQTLSLRNRDFAVAMLMIGESKSRLVFAEVLPHLTGIISAMFLRAVVAGVFAEAGLAFLGIGTTTSVSWGTMISEAQQQSAILNGVWWWFVPPGLCIAVLGTATALVNFGIDEVSNPRLGAANRKLIKQFERAAARLRARPGTEAVR
ncbi:ABC transporter permease [Microlunatus parietis]|uniref:Peptide/nickel transport system permease protein n=1 Tax=Microlunatus parietis TaxID=682979 RepID=A0A7Y9LAG2_9ACTN|nr:ABC transporter permease [Microlunatus parietis]NYE69763.1 peptide/nickel transport system permease protein [Microlunatus parietis]